MKRIPLLLSIILFGAFALLSCEQPRERIPMRQNKPLNSAGQVPSAGTGRSNPAGAQGIKAGAQAVDFKLADTFGNKVSLSAYHGKLVLLNFWATWCAPCVAEMPALERLYKKLNARGFEILAVSVDPADSRAEVQNFVSETGISFPVLHDPEISIPPLYGRDWVSREFFHKPKREAAEFFGPAVKG